MKVNNTSIVLKDLPEFNISSLTVGEKVNADVLKNLGKGYYLVNLKNSKIKIHSDVPLQGKEIFIVSEKTGGQIVLKPFLSSSFFSVSNLVAGYPSLSKIENPLINQIVFLMLKKNMRIDEENVLRIFNSISKSAIKGGINSYILRFLINLSGDGVIITPELINKVVEYSNFLINKKLYFKNKNKTAHLSDNKKDEIFNDKEKQDLTYFIKEINELMTKGNMRGAYYFIFPFITEEEEFYSEIKFYFEKNDSGNKDYKVSANIHLSTGEVKLRGTYINSYIYIKLYFENLEFLNLCKQDYENPAENKFDVTNVEFLSIDEIEHEKEVLFSDIYYKDEKIEYT